MAAGEPSRLKRALHPIPAEITRALKQRRLEPAYRARPPYRRNDYIGWITGAKRPETRARRLAQMLDELAAGESYMGMAWRRRR